MRDFELSKRAQDDIADIARYTIGQFGIKQARSYRDALIDCFESLAGNPKLGESGEDVRKGYRRYDFRSHAIFYKIEGRRISIIRVLHKSMNAPRHL